MLSLLLTAILRYIYIFKSERKREKNTHTHTNERLSVSKLFKAISHIFFQNLLFPFSKSKKNTFVWERVFRQKKNEEHTHTYKHTHYKHKHI